MIYDHDRSTWASKKPILVVASDPDLGFILTMILQEEVSHEVVLVVDGKEAIELCHLITPQLILLDEQLCGMCPQALYKRLCQCAANRPIPGVLLGTSHTQDDWQHLHRIKKPFHWDKLLQTVQALLDAP